MSLPTAQKDRTENPAKGSVTAPVNQREKDADVQRKLKLYGVIQAFRAGRMPDNTQIDSTLLYAIKNSPVDVSSLSKGGQKLINDFRDVIETARLIVKDKNADELFQEFVWETTGTAWDSHGLGKGDIPLDKEKTRSDQEQAIQHLRTLLHLLATNSEARKLLSDGSLIGRDLLARGAAKAAGAIAPDSERLAGVDDAAPRDKFHSPEDADKPVVQEQIPGTQHTVTSHPTEGVSVQTAGGEKKNVGQLKTEGQQVAGDLAATGQEKAKAHAEDVRGDAEGVPEEQQGEVAKKSLREKLFGMRDNMLDRVPQEHKDRANDHFDRGKKFLTEEYFPKERRDQFIYRFKKVILECQKHDDYQSSMQWLLDAVEQYAGHGKTMAKTGHGGAQNLSSDSSLSTGLTHLRTLLERFANGKSMQPILDAIRTLGEDAKQDEGLRGWLHQVDEYSRKLLMEPGYILQDDSDRRAEELKEDGRVYWDGKYKTHFDGAFDETGRFFGAMGEDPLNARFGQDLARLSRDLLFDSDGKLAYKPELWNDIRKVILPTLIEKVGYVPIPRIEYTDDGLDLVVENLTLSGPNLFPNIVTVEAHNFMKFSPYSTIADDRHHDLTLTFSHIQADLRDVAFYFRRKATPKLSDSGLADIILGGKGLTVSAHVRSAPSSDKSSVFYVKDVEAKLGDISLAIRDSKHQILYKTLKPLMMGLVKRQIKKAVEDGVRTALEYVDGQLVGVQQRMDEAKESDDDLSRVQVLQDIFKRKSSEAHSVKSKTDSHFKVSAKRESVLLPDQGHPAGWVNRASEKVGHATEGEKWHSKAFSIVGSDAAPAHAAGAGAGTTHITGTPAPTGVPAPAGAPAPGVTPTSAAAPAATSAPAATKI